MEKGESILLQKKLRSLYKRSAVSLLLRLGLTLSLGLEREVQGVLQLAVALANL